MNNNENQEQTFQQPVQEQPMQPIQPTQEQPVQPAQEPIQPIQQPVYEEPSVVEQATPIEPIMENPNAESEPEKPEEVKKEKKSKGPIVIIVLLILMVLGLAGYVTWDHFNVKEPEKPKEEKITVTKNEAEEYLEYVPFAPEYDLDETGLKNTSVYGPNAYVGRDITTNQMNEELLLAMAYKKVGLKKATPEKVEANFCGEAKTCQGDGYATIEDMNKQVKKMYDLNNIVSKEFSYPGGVVEKTDKYWALFMGKGNLYSLEKVSKIVDYKVDKDNNLIIREKAAFAIVDQVEAEAGDLYAYSVKTEKITSGQDPEAMFEKNIDKVTTFIHTFKLDENNNFYYYSTKVQ